LLITPRNEGVGADDVNVYVRDLTFRLNKMLNCCSGINLAGEDGFQDSLDTQRVLIENNLIITTRLDENNQHATGTGDFFLITSGPQDVTIRHNTMLQVGFGGSISAVHDSAPITDNANIRDNIISNGTGGWIGNSTGDGNDTFDSWFSSTDFRFGWNAIIGGTSGNYSNTGGFDASGNFFPANEAAVEFVDYAGGNYRLDPGSDFAAGNANDASDGLDLGADIDAIEAAYAGEEGGGSAIVPSSILMPQIAL
jgi:hypothetical protein